MDVINQATNIYKFFNSFGIPAYINGDVPENAVMPYITYQLHLGRELTTV